jgi:hypothetical protein
VYGHVDLWSRRQKVTIKDSYTINFSYPDINTCWKLSALSCDKKFIGINKISVNTTSAEIHGFQKYRISFLFMNTGSAGMGAKEYKSTKESSPFCTPYLIPKWHQSIFPGGLFSNIYASVLNKSKILTLLSSIAVCSEQITAGHKWTILSKLFASRRENIIFLSRYPLPPLRGFQTSNIKKRCSVYI